MRAWLWLALLPVILKGQPTAHQAYLAIHKIIQRDLHLPPDHAPLLIKLIDQDSIITLYFPHDSSFKPLFNDSTYFELAGLSEVFFAENILQNIEREVIQWNDTVTSLADQKGMDVPLTVKQLFTHHSGLPKIMALEPQSGQPAPLDFWNWLYRQKLNEPGKWQYTPLDYLVLQHFINRKNHLSWEAGLHVYQITGQELEHRNEPNILSTSFTKVEARDPDEFFKLYSNLTLLTHFLKTKLESEFLVRAPVSTTFPGLSFGSGWYIHQLRGNRIAMTHAGHSLNHKIFLGFVPHTRTGVILLTTHPFESKDLGWLILRWLNHSWKRKK